MDVSSSTRRRFFKHWFFYQSLNAAKMERLVVKQLTGSKSGTFLETSDHRQRARTALYHSSGHAVPALDSCIFFRCSSSPPSVLLCCPYTRTLCLITLLGRFVFETKTKTAALFFLIAFLYRKKMSCTSHVAERQRGKRKRRNIYVCTYPLASSRVV